MWRKWRTSVLYMVLIGSLITLACLLVILDAMSNKSLCTPELAQMVENTIKACNWCEEFIEKNKGSIDEVWRRYGVGPAICMGGGSCVACTEFYRAYHNLTFKGFPTYCWRSDESPPCFLNRLVRWGVDVNSGRRIQS